MLEEKTLIKFRIGMDKIKCIFQIHKDMTIRDYIAFNAPVSEIDSIWHNMSDRDQYLYGKIPVIERRIKFRYMYADAMIQAREIK